MHDKINLQFEEEVLEKGKNYGVVKGSFSYTKNNSDLDHYVGSYSVNYSVSFTKSSNGYKAIYSITDTYDFKWQRYDNIAIDFANNYCYVMQEQGLIQPFLIRTVYYS